MKVKSPWNFNIRDGSMVQQEVYTLSIGNGRAWHDAYFGIGSGPNLTLTIALHCPILPTGPITTSFNS